jgi:F-type H+-transporting ATPase subunit b
MSAIADRERSIEDALLKAEAAKEEMARLTNENEQLLKEARAERDLILREARQLKDQIVNEAKSVANVEGARMIEQARLEINSLKAIAMADVKNQVATLSIEIAEKILRKQFADQHAQDQLVADLLKEVKIK